MASQHSVLDELLANVPQDVEVFVHLIGDLAEQVKADMAAQGLNRSALAQRLGKSESEVTKWLSGMHNLTLQSVAKLSAALQIDLLVTRERPQGYFGQTQTMAARAVAPGILLTDASSVQLPQPQPRPKHLDNQTIAAFLQGRENPPVQLQDSADKYSYAMAA